MTEHVTASGQVISTITTTAHQAYQRLLAALAVKSGHTGPTLLLAEE
jgi:hypothetical protein